MSLEFFLNVFTEFSDKILECWNVRIFVVTVKGFKPATICVRNQDATTVPTRQMWETGYLNWAQFMCQWFIRFLEFAEFNESSALFRKNSIIVQFGMSVCLSICPFHFVLIGWLKHSLINNSRIILICDTSTGIVHKLLMLPKLEITFGNVTGDLCLMPNQPCMLQKLLTVI